MSVSRSPWSSARKLDAAAVSRPAAVTAVLFTLGKYLIALYLELSRGSIGQAYGVAGSLIITLFWVYYSAQILLFGAEFTQIYANKYGSRILPAGHAIYIPGRRPPEPEKEAAAAPPEPATTPLALAAESSQRQFEKQAAAALLGLAAGLLLAFLTNLRRNQ